MGGPIFLGEGIFAAAQMMPKYRNSKLVEKVTPGVVIAFVSQSIWNFAFAQELIPFSLGCMYGVLFGLLLVAAMTDGLATTWTEYSLIRAPLSLHTGWIIAASTLNTNVLFDYWRSPPEQMLGLAVTSIGVLCIMAAIFAFAAKSPNPIVCFVAAWAFSGIAVELSDGTALNDPNRHNPYIWHGRSGTRAAAARRAMAAACRSSWHERARMAVTISVKRQRAFGEDASSLGELRA